MPDFSSFLPSLELEDCFERSSKANAMKRTRNFSKNTLQITGTSSPGGLGNVLDGVDGGAPRTGCEETEWEGRGG